MPSQARDGSWSCDYCGMDTFRSFDDAKGHEHDLHESARKRPRSGSPSEQYTGSVSLSGMAPLTAVAASEMGGDYDSLRQKPLRRITLMAPDDMHQHQLDTADVLACQNLEVFEAGVEAEGNTQITPRQVGIRCLHCAQNPTDEYNMYFPGNIESLGDGIRMVADRHFAQCPAAPAQTREEYQRVSEKRSRLREEGRSTMEEERSQMAMTTYCAMFCRNCGIVDKFPNQRQGMTFVESERQLYAPTPRHARAPDMPYSSLPGPFPTMMSQMGDSIAPTPLARSNRDPNDPSLPPTFEGGFSSGYPTSYGVQTPHGRADTGQDGPSSQQQGPPQDLSFAMSPYGVPPPPPQQEEYPYFQDSSSTWSCKYCSGILPQYRDQGSTWNSPDPPPSPFMTQHLRGCQPYNQGMSTTPRAQGMYQGRSPAPQYGYSQPSPSFSGGPPPPQSQPRAQAPMPYYSTASSGGNPNLSYTPQAQSSNSPRQGMSSRRPEEAVPPMQPASATRGNAPSNLLNRPVAVGDVAAQQAIDYLVAAEQDMYRLNPQLATIEQLVLDEDKMLLTDYFFYLMKQLRVCRFAEADRKTRGGKRENIAVGYGGLQCIHCAEQANARKFFWSNVDRLANSFAEIPAHVLKCRRCPNQTKTAIMDLKARHPEQMARLPRGSQKVFFRRMWRRLHESDPQPARLSPEAKESAEKPVVEIPAPLAVPQQPAAESISPSSHQLERTASSPSTDESAMLFERPTDEAAKALAASMTHSDPPSPSSRVLLGIPEDKEWLSDMDCFIRRNLEVFCATAEDVDLALQDRKYPITVGQVGIRCIHCALAGGRTACRGNAVAYPYSISGVYEAVREFERLHLGSCTNVPAATKQKLEGFKGRASSLSSVLRKYYVLASKALGMYDTQDGIRSGGESVPLGSSAAFAFAEGSTVSEEMRKGAEGEGSPTAESIKTGPTATASESRKRKQPDEPSGEPPTDTKPSAAAVKSEDP